MSFTKGCCRLICGTIIALMLCSIPSRADDGEKTPLDAKTKLHFAGSCSDSSGKAIFGADVRLHYVDGQGSQPSEVISHTRTEKDGKFELTPIELSERLVENGNYFLAISYEGHVSESIKIRNAENHEELIVVLETSPATLVGIVTGPNGKPLANAQVYLPSFGLHCIDGFQSGTTDINGKFLIRDLRSWDNDDPKRTRPLVIRHPTLGIKQVRYSSVPQVLRVQMDLPGIIVGRVIDMTTGLAVPNVWVSAQGVGMSGWYQDQTDEHGVYELRMEEDRYNIWAEMDDRVPIAIDSILASKGEKQLGVDVRMVRGAIVKGQVAGDDPKLFAGQRVANYGPARPRSGAAVSSTQVNEDGNYELRVAPGENYIYLMSGQGSAKFHAGNGRTIKLNLVPTERLDLRKRKEDPVRDAVLEQARLERRERMPLKMGEQKRPKPASRLRSNDQIGKLLDRLETQNSGPARFTDAWLRTLKEIVDVGEAAVPELIAELDETNNDMMMRCIGFTLRAIGDKRAVPALIRAIPKTLIPPGSDMGLRAQDEFLLEFAQANDTSDQNRGNSYSFSRPVREIFAAIHKLTGHRMNDNELFSIFRDGTVGQQQRKENLFQARARKWATWWEQNAAKLGVDEKHLVNLPKYEPHEIQGVDVGIDYKTDSGGSNWILQMAQAEKPRTVFFDLDTNRRAGLPSKYAKMAPDKRPFDEIARWAREQGFDMMGTEHPTKDGEACYAIRLLGMRAFQLPDERWKMKSKGITLEELIEEGTEIGEYLFQHDGEQPNYFEKGSFFVVTAEETPALLFLGIEVRDDSLKPGGISTGDDELDPVAFHKGRRFAYTYLVPAE